MSLHAREHKFATSNPRRGPAEVKLTLSASISPGAGTITWYERRSAGGYVKKGTGESFKVRGRARAGQDLIYYVTVTREGEPEGAKLPVRIPVQAE